MQNSLLCVAVFSLGIMMPAAGLSSLTGIVLAQAPTVARATPQRGTVKAIEGTSITLVSDTGPQVTLSVPVSARIQRLSPGSSDLKTAEPATLTDIAVGDRLLVSGTPGDAPNTLNASRVILMKSVDIAQKRAAEQQDWQRRGVGGIVSAVVPPGTITVSAGSRKLEIITTAKTIFRRYADGSVKFEDAKAGTLSQIRSGDQILVRGTRSDDGNSITAEEVVSGSFRNLAGQITSIDQGRNTLSIRDLATKKDVTVQLTDSSALHRLPADAAAHFAAIAKGTQVRPGSSRSTLPSQTVGAGTSSDARSGEGSEHSGGATDLSKAVARLPAMSLDDLKPGEAVMVVAEQSSGDSSTLTAITLLAGVEPLLLASPGGSSTTTLSPWTVGSGAPEGGTAQ